MSKCSFRERVVRIIAKNEYLFFIIKYWRLRLLMACTKTVPDEAYIKKQYKIRTGKKLNLHAPRLYNEKVQYTKLYYRNPKMHQLVDKYEVRRYVESTIGEKYLTRIYGVYNTVDEIPFDKLPSKFVVKLTNGSGFNYICHEKSEKEIKKIESRFKKWLKLDFYMLGREWAYKDVPNRIICEEYLECDDKLGLNDYKVFCFNGVPKLIHVNYLRFIDHKVNLYTPEWDFIDERIGHDNDPDADIPKPENLEEMLSCARTLSKTFPHVRVDFYNIGSRLVFGEMTFYHGAGYLHFENESFEQKMGSYWEI